MIRLSRTLTKVGKRWKQGKQALAQLEQQPGIPAEMLEKQKDELAKQEQLLAEKETELANLKAPTYYYFY